MVQATFFTQQNVSMTVLPPERKDNSTANPDDESLATTVLKPCQSPKPIVWVQPAETGAVLCPQDALLASFQYTDCRGRMLALTPTDVLRWTQAAKGLHDTCGNFNTFIRLLNSISSDLKENLSCGGEMSESLRRFQRVVTSLVESTSVLRHQRSLFTLLVILSFLYGGLHLSAWQNPFPTDLECIIWKMSCFIIGGMLPVIIGVWMVCSRAVRKFQISFEKYTNKAIGFLSLILITMYGLARLFIMMEAFISLRSQPIGVYWSPDWLQTVPHI